MKIAHIADTHLGLAAFSRLDPASGMNLREKQVYGNFLAAIREIVRQKPDAVVHAGDLFDTVKPKTRAYTTALEALDILGEAGIPFVVIAGNHSMVKTRYTTSPFEVLAYHPSRIAAAYRFRYERVEIGDAVFHLIPNMLRPGDYRTAYDEVEIAPSRFNVLVTHGLASAIKDRRLATVAEHELDNTILSERFDYIALGHYHRQSQMTGNAWYSGSIEHLTYGEIADTKGGLLVEIGRTPPGPSGGDPCNRVTVRHLDLPKTPMFDLGTIPCRDLPPAAITGEIASRVAALRAPELSMAQVTLDGLPREHGKGPETKGLAAVKEQLLDLRIRVVTQDGEHPAPLQQDIRAIDYLGEFGSFLEKQQLSPRQKEYIARNGPEILRAVMEEHREGEA